MSQSLCKYMHLTRITWKDARLTQHREGASFRTVYQMNKGDVCGRIFTNIMSAFFFFFFFTCSITWKGRTGTWLRDFLQFPLLPLPSSLPPPSPPWTSYDGRRSDTRELFLTLLTYCTSYWCRCEGAKLPRDINFAIGTERTETRALQHRLLQPLGEPSTM